MLRWLSSFLRATLRRRRFEDGLAEEVRFHLEEYTDDLVRSGVPPSVSSEPGCHRAARISPMEALTEP